MKRSFEQFFNPHKEDPRSFGRLILTVQIIVFFTALGITLSIKVNKAPSLALAVILAGTIILSLRRIHWPAQIVTPLSIILISALFMYRGYGSYDVAIVGLVGGIVIGGLLLGRQGLLLAGIPAILVYTGFAIAERSGTIHPKVPDYANLIDLFVFIFITLAISLGLWTLIGRLGQIADQARQSEKAQIETNRELNELKSVLETRVGERTAELERRVSQLEAVSTVARAISTVQNLERLLPTVTRVVSEHFGYYHTGIFLIDERGEYAILQASNSAGGQRMLERGHRLRVGLAGIVGAAAAHGQPRVALDVGADAVYFNNPDLPDTRSEIALPLKIGGQIIGVLDVQSVETDAFQQEDIAALSVLASQVAIAIENARLFSQTRQALADSQAIYQQYVRQDWARFARTFKNKGYSYNGIRVAPLETAAPPSSSQALTIPIQMRGIIVGNIVIQPNNPLRAWSQDEISLARAAAERAGLALENFRLLNEAQRRAAKEHAIGEISARIGASANIREIMLAAVEGLGQTLPGAEIVLQFEEKD